MSELELNPAAARYQAASETARSLARTLQAAPAQESRRAAALRKYLVHVALALADACDRWQTGTDVNVFAAERWVASIGYLSTELTHSLPITPPGVAVVLQALAARWSPNTLLLIGPKNAVTGSSYIGAGYLESFQDNVQEIGWAIPPISDLPRRLLVLRYPYGEQDNVLQSCLMIGIFGDHTDPEFSRGMHLFGAFTLGPAYFFALAASLERSFLSQDKKASQLRYTARILEVAGWFDNAIIGPLLKTRIEQVGLALPLGEETILDMGEVVGYTPADFDRDAPRLWERLKQLLPPNELEMEAVESAQPADAVSILNAGWSFHLLHMDSLYAILGSRTPEDKYEALQVLNRLLTKGVELSEITRRWNAARQEA